jgi:hypothetical protein
MRTFITVILIALLTLLAEYYFPWWSVAVVSFVIGLFLGIKPGKAFLAGFLGIALTWLLVSLIKDIPNQHILSMRMAGIFHLPGYAMFIFVCTITGGLTGGIAAWSGSCVKRIL